MNNLRDHIMSPVSHKRDDGETGHPAGQPRTVLQVLPNLNMGGVERGTVDLARHLIRQGWRAVVVSNGGPLVAQLEKIGAVHITLPVHAKSFFTLRRNVKRLRQVIREHQVDVVHARSRAPAWSARSAARKEGVAFVTTYHSAYKDSNRIKRFYNSVMASGDKVIAISDFIADRIRRIHRVESKRLVRIHRGVDLDIFDPAKVTSARMIQLADAWRLPDGGHVILLPGRLTRLKGHSVLIDAMSRLKDQQAIAVLVGSDEGREDYREELEKSIRARGLESRVRLVGGCRDMSAAYMLSDVVVSASLQPEGFGRTVAEAQAMGRPVIVSDHGGAKEVIDPGWTGLAVKPDDAAALAKALDKMLTIDEHTRTALAERARQRVIDNFSLAGMCEKTMDVYKSVIKPRRWN